MASGASPKARAARAFATAIAGDDPRQWCEAFTAAYNLPDSQASPVGRTRMRAAAKDPEKDLYDDPTFLANARVLARSRTRIVGGQDTAGFADCVAIGSPDGWCCTGAVIAPSVVVTAGHCHAGDCASRVFVGNDVRGPGREVAVRAAVSHPGYQPPREQDDLTILLLAEPAGVKPVRLATPDALIKRVSVRIVGFGNTNNDGTTGFGRKREVDVAMAGWQPWFGADQKTEFTAGEPFSDRDSCTGDSGGPAYAWTGGGWALVGATSRATRSSVRNCGDGGIYTFVPVYRDWVGQVSGAELA